MKLWTVIPVFNGTEMSTQGFHEVTGIKDQWSNEWHSFIYFTHLYQNTKLLQYVKVKKKKEHYFAFAVQAMKRFSITNMSKAITEKSHKLTHKNYFTEVRKRKGLVGSNFNIILWDSIVKKNKIISRRPVGISRFQSKVIWDGKLIYYVWKREKHLTLLHKDLFNIYNYTEPNIYSSFPRFII